MSPPRRERQPLPEADTIPSAALGASRSVATTTESEPRAGTVAASFTGAILVSARSNAISVVWSRPAIVATAVLPSDRPIWTSPSSARASSAVTIRPGFQTNPVERERCECTETMDGAVRATTSASADESEDRGVGSVMDMRGDDDLVGSVAVEHRDLAAGKAPALGCLVSGGRDLGEIEPRCALGMRKGELERSVGDLRQPLLLLRGGAARLDQRRSEHDRRDIRLGHQPTAKRLHQNPDLDRAAAEPAKLLRDRQRQPAELGELFPDIRAVSERIVRHLAAMIGIVAFGDKALRALAQQPLLVAEIEVHDGR